MCWPSLPPLLAALALSLCALHAPHAAAQPLTLAEAIARALAGHPELAAARSEVDAVDAARRQARERPDPTLEAEMEDTRRATRSTTVMLVQPLELGGKRAARIEAAERARALAEGRYAAQRAELRAAVTGAFFDVVAAEQRIRLAGDALALAGRASEAAHRRVLAGKVAPIEETKARVAEASVRVELAQAQGERRAALQSLAAAVGAPGVDDIAAGEVPLPGVPSDRALQARLADAPALRNARLEVERLDALARLARTERMPDVEVGVGVKRSQELGRNQAVLSLSIPLPFAERAADLEALRRRDKAGHEARAAELRLRAEAARAHERLRASVAEAQALQAEVLPGAQQAYEAASTGFELGKFGFLDVLDAQRTLIQARTQQLRAVAQAHRAAADIDRLLGEDAATAPVPARPGETP
jgi:outer membrane protein, heavy metal efflux system